VKECLGEQIEREREKGESLGLTLKRCLCNKADTTYQVTLLL